MMMRASTTSSMRSDIQRRDGCRQEKRAVRVNERPKSREETPKEGYDKRAGLAMSHRKSYWCAAPFSNAIFAELPYRNQGPGA
jgi:hypothetical protein